MTTSTTDTSAAPRAARPPRPASGTTRAPRQPQDRKRTADEIQADAIGERPDGADLLRPPETLRTRERARLLELAERMRATLGQAEGGLREGATEEEQIHAATLSLGMVSDFDEVLESLAIEPATYAQWATAAGGPHVETRVANLAIWYVNAMGE